MTSSPSPSPTPSTASPTPTPNPIPDADNPAADLPLTMSASVLLTSLPRDAKSALSSAAADGSFDQRKVTIRFQPIGSAPILRTKVFKISASQRFETVVAFLRRRLDAAITSTGTATNAAGAAAGAGGGGGGGGGGGKASGGSGSGKSRVGERENRGESVFCYVNSCFAPGGDEVVGNLWRCFKTDDQLIVAYAMTPAFG